MDNCDLLIIGGGIHGAGLARDAAGRGLSVLMCERGDLAGETSSASSKLIHGGLRYLEHMQLRLVREALSEREILLATAPHLVQPLMFVLPLGPGSRPGWELRLGLFLYDHLGGRGTLPGSRALSLPGTPFGAPLRSEFVRGFLYADCRADDARLVIANARAAAGLGARVLPRTAATAAQRHADHWLVTLTPESGAPSVVRARAVVNAAGPWVDAVLTGVAGLRPRHGLRLVKGSHIVVPNLYAGNHAYILQQPDRRVVFLIPMERDFTVIGTTDVAQGEPGTVPISPAETDYLCAAANRFLARPVAPHDVVWSWSGTRSLADDGSDNPAAVTRDDVLDLDTGSGTGAGTGAATGTGTGTGGGGGAPLLSVYGGKLTTYRRMAERMLRRLQECMPVPHGPWTADAPLPGGDLPRTDAPHAAVQPHDVGAGAHGVHGGRLAAFVAQLTLEHPGLPAALLAGLARRHGSECATLLAGAATPADLGRDFGGGLHERELRWMIEHEWARTADDVLWRRSKAGLHLSSAQRAAVAEFMEQARR